MAPLSSWLGMASSSTTSPPPDVPIGSSNKQWLTTQNGLDKLETQEVDVPTPRDGEVLVKISAVSLNYRDTEVCMGQYSHHKSISGPPQPIVPCSDMCGLVAASKSSLLKPGTRVAAVFNQTHLSGQVTEDDLASGLGFPLPGVLAQYRCFPAEALVRIPDYLTDEEASCLPIASVTAWMSINGMRPLGQPIDITNTTNTTNTTTTTPSSSHRQAVLVQGTGGVSIAGLQIAKAAGLVAIVTSSSDAKLERAQSDLGADHAINYRTHWAWQQPVLDATAGRGADIVFETGGARTLRKSFECVAFGGLINCIGYLSGKEEEDNPELNSRLNVNVLALRRNVTLRGILNGPKDRFEEMLRFYEEKKIRPVVGKTFAFDEAKDALEYLAKGAHFGKVVIKVT